MNHDRRSTTRCPVCQGPTVSDPKRADGMRCRNSACKHNHAKAQCPRCSNNDISQVSWKDNTWTYSCSDCQHRWRST